MNTPYDTFLEQNRRWPPSLSRDDTEQEFGWKRESYLACLQSPEVTALRTALEAVADGDITDGQLCWCHGTTEHEAFCLQARAALAPWTEGAGQPVGKDEAS